MTRHNEANKPELLPATTDQTALTQNAGEPAREQPHPTPSAAHGVWVGIGDRQFAVTFIILYVNAGHFVGSLKVRKIANLEDTLDTFTGPYQAEYRDASGNIFLTGTGNVQGSRIGVDVLPRDELK